MPSSSGTSAQQVLLRVAGLCAWYGEAQILHDVSLEVRRGEVVALMGRNGAGKSTTMRSLVGLVARRSGVLDFMGHDLLRLQPYQAARCGLGYVPEDRRVFSELTVLENLDLGRQPVRVWPDGSEVPQWTVERLLDLFPLLLPLLKRPAGLLSGGEQQMLSVARTLMGNPYLVLLDEPSEGVAPVVVEQMVEMIQALKAHGVSVLLSEQNLHFSALVCERAYVLEKGCVRYDGSLSALRQDEEKLRSLLSI
ncbi:ABC transporter ATP-binding protein [Paracandidimonas soli]|uniref:Branched-chain amino acid transport system ATP-binding protein n=1 Tax=Paracandidimonas soli TaxID=1917182 RepID=A0A4R3VC52_9BURK|nr:ABC transporter ATP-binding protein [Paracandidimonas soli]TCV01383.1 branched-chain amino acid transport system ATP-binding protein [Paracandidimonas soli]